MVSFQRKSSSGSSVCTWLTSSGPVFIRKHVCHSKNDPIVEEAELLEANPEYAFVRLRSGHETTVSLRDLAPCVGGSSGNSTVQPVQILENLSPCQPSEEKVPKDLPGTSIENTSGKLTNSEEKHVDTQIKSPQSEKDFGTSDVPVVIEKTLVCSDIPESEPLRRSSRPRRSPERFLDLKWTK